MAGSAAQRLSVRFDLTKATVIPGDDAERMYGLVFEIDAEGRPALSQCYDLPGRAPEYHESPDVGRIYRFEVKDLQVKQNAQYPLASIVFQPIQSRLK